MASKRRFEYRTRILVLEGSADGAIKSNATIQEALNDPEMHDGGFELDQIVSLSRGSTARDFTNFIVVLVVFSRAVRE